MTSNISYNLRKDGIQIQDSLTGKFENVQVPTLRKSVKGKEKKIITKGNQLAAHVLFQLSTT